MKLKNMKIKSSIKNIGIQEAINQQINRSGLGLDLLSKILVQIL